MSKLIINEENKLGEIAPEIYGHFSEHLGRCIYEGIYVGENSEIPNVNGMRVDVVEALKELKVPMLRWPGGCFADEYHWKDGVGPKDKRKKMINTHWGGVVEDNSFGTHEYMELCRQLGCKTYVNGNLGSGTVQEMSEWVEYMTFNGVSPMADWRAENGHKEPWKVDFFGVGNENWGCGGNMTPEFYANEYRRYQTYVRDYKEEDEQDQDQDDDQEQREPSIRKVCCGANIDDYFWTKGVMKTCFSHTPKEFHGYMDYLSLHYYVHPEGWKVKGSSTDFDEEVWYKTMYKAYLMEELVSRHSAIMDQYDPEKKIGLCVDEWGAWYKNEPGTNPGFLYQQNTVRDALIAGITLNIFNKHCDRVKIAALAQVVNVLQAVLLTEGDQMIKTPTYHVMHMYRHHQGAQLLESALSGVDEVGVKAQPHSKKYMPVSKKMKDPEYWMVPKVTESVSMDEGGTITITLNNLSISESEELDVQFASAGYKVAEARIVTDPDMHAHNTFEQPGKVREKSFSGYQENAQGFHVTLPPNSVVEIRAAR